MGCSEVFIKNNDDYKDIYKEHCKLGSHLKIIDEQVVSNVAYILASDIEDLENKFIIIVEMNKRGASCSIKVEDETYCRNAFFNCPKRILKASTNQTQHAINWRNKNLELQH